MQICLVAALAANRVIGTRQKLPWNLPADHRRFKTVTMGKPIIMGRKTFESLAKPLPGRKNIVVTRDRRFTAKGTKICHSLEDAINLTHDAKQVMIIGGGQIYQQALDIGHCMYLTMIHRQFPGDVYFPSWSPQQWEEVNREDHTDRKTGLAYSFVQFNRKNGKLTR